MRKLREEFLYPIPEVERKWLRVLFTWFVFLPCALIAIIPMIIVNSIFYVIGQFAEIIDILKGDL